MSLRKYITYSTVGCAFSGALAWHWSVDIRAFYFVVLLNLFLFALAGTLRLSLRVTLVCGYLVCSGALGMWQGTDTLPNFLKQFIGISIIAFYYYNFSRQPDATVERIFGIYARIAYWVSALGLLIVVGQLGFLHHFERLRSILSEPADFSRIVLPAFYFYADRWLSKRLNGREALVLLTGLVLSVSSLGYIGLLLAFYLLATRFRYYTVVAPAVLLLLALATYMISPEIRMRVDDTSRATAEASLEGANLSTYALISNVFITREVFLEHPVFGNGLGSHGLSHARYLASLNGVEQFISSMYGDLNADDAASLFLRVLSEMGLVGIGFVLIFLVSCYVRDGGQGTQYSNALLLYMVQKLLRGGHYFSPEMYLFVFLYVMNHIEARQAVALWKPVSVSAPAVLSGSLES